MGKPTLEAEVKGLGEVHRINAPFDEGYKSLRAIHAKLISLRNLAYGRIKTGAKHSLSTNGSWVMEGGLLRKKQLPLLLRKSLVLAHPANATNAHRKGHEYFIDKETEEKYSALAEKEKTKAPEKRKALILTSRQTYSIPTDEFDKHDETRWAFQDQAKFHGDFLKANGIDNMPINLDSADYVDKQKSSYAVQLWLHGLGDVSGLDAGDWDYDRLGDDGALRGVCAEGAKRTAEGCSHIKLPYTTRQVDSMLKIVQGVEQGKFGHSKLEDVVGFLKVLRGK